LVPDFFVWSPEDDVSAPDSFVWSPEGDDVGVDGAAWFGEAAAESGTLKLSAGLPGEAGGSGFREGKESRGPSWLAIDLGIPPSPAAPLGADADEGLDRVESSAAS
jgi:hypothetical protein